MACAWKSAAGSLSEADMVQVNTLLTANASEDLTALPRPAARAKPAAPAANAKR